LKPGHYSYLCRQLKPFWRNGPDYFR